MNMADIKVITVVVGDGGQLAMSFDQKTGELRIWPNEQVVNAADNATRYELAPGLTIWSMADTAEELKGVKP